MTDPTTDPTGDLLTTTMRRHDDDAPDPDVVVRRVLARLEEPARVRLPIRALGLTAGAVAAAAVVTTVLATGGEGDVSAVDPATSRPATGPATVSASPGSGPTSTPTPPPRPRAVLDPLRITLRLGEPGPGGTMPSQLRVENRSGRGVVDPGCRLANYRWGLVPEDRPAAFLPATVMTRCAGPRRLPDGYTETWSGPRFAIPRGLAPGTYLATIDFGDARSARLTVPVDVP